MSLDKSLAINEDDDVDDTTTFEIDLNRFKNNLEINGFEDLIHLLHTIKYWDIEMIPYEIVKYVISNKGFIRDKINEIIEEIGELEIIDDIKYLMNSNNIKDVITYYSKKKFNINSKKEVHTYLHSSKLYKNLYEDDDIDDTSTFEIDLKLFKNNLEINDFEDLIHLLNTIKYWDIEIIPYEIVKYIISNKTFIRDKINEIIEEIGELEIIDDIQYLIHSPNIEDVLRYYTKKNNLHIISKFCEIDKVWDNDIQLISAICGHLEILKYSIKHELKISKNMVDRRLYLLSAMNGHINCMSFIKAVFAKINKNMIVTIPEIESIQTMNFLSEHIYSTEANHIITFKSIIIHTDSKLIYRLYTISVERGFLECIKLLFTYEFMIEYINSGIINSNSLLLYPLKIKKYEIFKYIYKFIVQTKDIYNVLNYIIYNNNGSTNNEILKYMLPGIHQLDCLQVQNLHHKCPLTI